MKKAFILISFLATFLLLAPAIASSAQFKITIVYDGETVETSGYDTQCRARNDFIMKVSLAGLKASEISKTNGSLG